MKRVILSTAVVLGLSASALPAAAQEPTPRATDDSCPATRVPGSDFWDVPGTSHEAAIDCVVWWDVAAGNSLVTYNPGGSVTRAQMATFIARLIDRSGGTLPAPSKDHFSDDNGNPHEPNINRLAEAGIVGGTGGGKYAPSGPVNRAQMATFLVRAYQHRSGTELKASRDYFSDDNGNNHEENINKAAEAGFTGGTSGGGYAPADNVTRGQMATFLARVLDLVVEQTDSTPPAEATRRLSGTGNTVIEGSIPGDRPVIVTFEHTGPEDNVIVWSFNEKGEDSELIVNAIGNYSGTSPMNLAWADPARGFEIDAPGEWNMVIHPLEWARDFGPSGGTGTSDDVVDGRTLAGSTVTITYTGESNFIITVYTEDAEYLELVVNEIGDYSGQHRIPNDAVWFVVESEGSWSVTR